MNKGKFIVFEGADGSGKSTQARFFFNSLQKKKIQVVLTSFPRYESEWGKMIRRYLDGEFGGTGDVNPYLASVLYAGDRLLAAAEIKKWLSEGKIVICDRYVASNIAHQAAKIKSQSEKLKFIKWCEGLEFGENKVPKPNFVFLLTIPTELAQKFMAKRVKDIHEKDMVYQRAVAKEYENYAKEKKGWVIVSNMKDNKLRTLEDVHLEITKHLKLGLTL